MQSSMQSTVAMLRSIIGVQKIAPDIEAMIQSLNMPEYAMPAAAVIPKAREWPRNLIWRRALERMTSSMYGMRYSSGFSGTLVITKIYADGTVCGIAKSSEYEHQVFIRIDVQGAHTIPAGCNCQRSRGKSTCEHTNGFVYYLLEELTNADSVLSKRLNENRFDSGQLDLRLYEFDESRLYLTKLERLSSIAPTTTEEASELPPAVENEPMRIGWNFELKGNSVEFASYIQTARKRGDGWVRGRKVSFSSLMSSDVSLSIHDRRVLKRVKISSDRYSRNEYVDASEAAMELIGQSNVMLDGKPATVRLFDAMMRITKVQDGLKFAFITDPSKPNSARQVFFGASGVVAMSTEWSTIDVYHGSQVQIETIKEIIQIPPIKETYAVQIVANATRLQSIINFQLPENVAGPLIPVEPKPVLLLRSRKDGSLDYGIRARDEQGVLRKPGEGVLVRTGKHDGKTVQWLRSFAKERDMVQKLHERFQFKSGECEGTLTDVEQILNMLEQLQENPSTLEVLWDKSSEKPIHVLGTISANNVRVGISQKRDWFSLQGECRIGNESIEIASLLEGLRTAASDTIQGNFVRLGDQGWVRISQQLRESLRKLDDSVNQERGALRFDQTSAHTMRDLQQHLQIDASKAWNDCLKKLDRAEKLDPVLPEGLNATLRDYQVEGYRWLRRLAEWGVGGILADDMGLGKTLQTLAVLLDRAHEGPSLVIAPTSVGFNWMREVEKFAPQLQASLYRETDRGDFLETLGPNQLVVCSYGLALRDVERLAKVKWANMILDEAQAIKNSRSKTSIAIASIPSQWTIALTGTPVENHLGELWSLFRVVAPGVFGGWEHFRNRFASPIERENDSDRREALKNRLKPFVLRRTKKEVLKDLPERTEMNLYVELSPAERALYDQVRQSAVGEIDSIAKLPDIQDQRFKILALLTRLRQIACHPRIVHESWKDRSAKLNQLTETLTQLREEGHRALIFSQFVQHLSLIREMMDEEKISYQYLDGSTPAEKRQDEVDRFQNGDATAFLISLKAGGTGLNLTAADYVIHMDPWWNPAVEDQATDRAHRIGQDKPVMVYRIVAQNTIEEEILRLHETKRDLVAGILDGSHTAAKLSTADLISLIRT